eukprot:TRINITY_DN10387_c0_g1_i1.p1 TRINITY_DN10387_c0_g1~~TRINITY_DN10387_c0_g1_i1.p1  ORF type:complete len:338 (-),score=63.24 TRINITY_DN10387_c0_g1_i1:25-1038(-)
MFCKTLLKKRAQLKLSTSTKRSASSSRRVKSLAGKSIISYKQFDKQTLDELFDVASNLKKAVEKEGVLNDLHGKFLANMFWEPSTRTASSFEVAMKRLGGQVTTLYSQFSSHQKGETLQDTVRVVKNYVDAIVIRHPEAFSAETAHKWAKIPVINAGDGANEHPTQALLDMFCVKEELKKLEGITFTLLGDLKFGRTVHSMAPLLALYGCKINLISPDVLKMPGEYIELLRQRGAVVEEGSDLSKVLKETDALYVTRVQKERFATEEEYNKVKGSYVINRALLSKAPQRMLVLHPLPRVNEISPDIDDDQRSMYFKEPKYGMIMRMALLNSVLAEPK